MTKVLFVEGGMDDYTVIYDTEWPIVPRTGEFLSITGEAGQVIEWEITKICYHASRDEKLTSTLAWVRRTPPKVATTVVVGGV